MCPAHTASALPAPSCYDCRARQQQDYGSSTPGEDHDTSGIDDRWVYGMRSRYLPASAAGSRYDARDASAFVAARDELEDLDDTEGGFGDS
jgi:hypothetical protein